MRRSSSEPTLPAQTGHHLQAAQVPVPSPQRHRLLRLLLDREDEEYQELVNRNIALKLRCTKAEDGERKITVEVSQLRAKNESLSAAQKEQRAEVASEKKRTREQHEERILAVQDDFGAYKKQAESNDRDLRSKIDSLVRNIEELNGRSTQANISNAESKRQGDEAVKMRQELETRLEELQQRSRVTLKELAEAHAATELEVSEINRTSREWQIKEREYLQVIEELQTEYQTFRKQNFEMTNIVEKQTEIWGKTLERHRGEKPEKRQKTSDSSIVPDGESGLVGVDGPLQRAPPVQTHQPPQYDALQAQQNHYPPYQHHISQFSTTQAGSSREGRQNSRFSFRDRRRSRGR